MRLPKKNVNELVAVSCTPTTLACAWMRPTAKAGCYELKGYKRITFNQLELAHTRICHPTSVEKHLTSFLNKHNLAHAYLVIGLRGPLLHEALISLPTMKPQTHDIPVPKKQHHLWDYRYLYTNDNAQSAFYVCSIPQTLLLQYKLLAIRQHLNIISVTTLSMAHLHAYAYGYGAAFRHSQLANDMQRCNNFIDNLVPPDILRRRLIIPAHYAPASEQELPILTSLFGLTVSEQGSL